MRFLKNLASFFGRFFFAIFFAVYAYSQALEPGGAREWLGLGPFYLLALAILFEALGAISLFLGFKTSIGAFLLILVVGRAAWVASPGGLGDFAFLKNLAICGGLLTLFSAGPGDWSMDGSGGGGGGGSKKSAKE